MIGLWHLPQELRDLVYDYLLDDVATLTRISKNACVHVTPAVPVQQMLTSRKMYDELRRRWSDTSEVVVIGHGNQCVATLRSLAKLTMVWTSVRSVKISMTSGFGYMILHGDRLGAVYLKQDTRSQLPELLDSCHEMPQLQSLHVELKTVGVVQDLRDLVASIIQKAEPNFSDIRMSRSVDRWHQAVRMESKFIWSRKDCLRCEGRFVHLAIGEVSLLDDLRR
jgi:hypothetical protein